MDATKWYRFCTSPAEQLLCQKTIKYYNLLNCCMLLKYSYTKVMSMRIITENLFDEEHSIFLRDGTSSAKSS